MALTKDRTWFEGIAAKLVLGRTNDPHCGNISHHQDEHWQRQLGLSKEDPEFWWMHDAVEQIHGDGSLKLLESHLTSDAERTLRAAQESMMAWQVYFDGLYYEGLRSTAAKG